MFQMIASACLTFGFWVHEVGEVCIVILYLLDEDRVEPVMGPTQVINQPPSFGDGLVLVPIFDDPTLHTLTPSSFESGCLVAAARARTVFRLGLT